MAKGAAQVLKAEPEGLVRLRRSQFEKKKAT